MEGVATTDGHAVGIVDSVDGQSLVVNTGKFDTKLFVYGSYFGFVSIVALGEAVRGQANACIGNEEHSFHIVPTAEVGNHVLAPAEVGIATHGAVADKQKISFVHGLLLGY